MKRYRINNPEGSRIIANPEWIRDWCLIVGIKQKTAGFVVNYLLRVYEKIRSVQEDSPGGFKGAIITRSCSNLCENVMDIVGEKTMALIIDSLVNLNFLIVKDSPVGQAPTYEINPAELLLYKDQWSSQPPQKCGGTSAEVRTPSAEVRRYPRRSAEVVKPEPLPAKSPEPPKDLKENEDSIESPGDQSIEDSVDIKDNTIGGYDYVTYEYELTNLLNRRYSKELRSARPAEVGIEDFINTFVNFLWNKEFQFDPSLRKDTGLVKHIESHGRYCESVGADGMKTKQQDMIKPDKSQSESIATKAVDWCKRNWRQVKPDIGPGPKKRLRYGRTSTGALKAKDWFDKQVLALTDALHKNILTTDELKEIMDGYKQYCPDSDVWAYDFRELSNQGRRLVSKALERIRK